MIMVWGDLRAEKITSQHSAEASPGAATECPFSHNCTIRATKTDLLKKKISGWRRWAYMTSIP
jgi:hypothetical protein